MIKPFDEEAGKPVGNGPEFAAVEQNEAIITANPDHPIFVLSDGLGQIGRDIGVPAAVGPDGIPSVAIGHGSGVAGKNHPEKQQG